MLQNKNTQPTRIRDPGHPWVGQGGARRAAGRKNETQPRLHRE